MIFNIVDLRKRRYRWKSITAIVEPISHDNSVADSDQTDDPEKDFLVYDQKEKISLADAIVWAQSMPEAVTLYLYDLGQGINVAEKA